MSGIEEQNNLEISEDDTTIGEEEIISTDLLAPEITE